MAGVPTPRELDDYRDQADRFLAEMDEEYYLHFAGHKESLDLSPIYDRHAELTGLDQANRIGSAVDGDRRTRELWKFACHGYLGNLTRDHDEKTAALEAGLKATVDGEEIPYRMIRPTMANEPDRAKRQRLEHARNALTEEHLLPLQLEAAAGRLGGRRTRSARRRTPSCTAASASGSTSWPSSAARSSMRPSGCGRTRGDRLFRERVGVGLAEAQRFDIGSRVPGAGVGSLVPRRPDDPGARGDARRPRHRPVRAGERRARRRAAREEVAAAFCSPIEVPQRVVLVIQPIGGVDDWRALFHEAGHTEHFAHTRADLSIEERRLGDYAVTEGWAMLFEHLVQDAAWLNRRLDVPRPAEFVAESASGLLYLVRRYCAKVLYELELHQAADPRPLQKRYVEILGDALKIEPSPTDYLADVDPGFYCTEYVRAWAFEAQLKSSSARSSGRPGSRAATPGRCCASSGPRGSGRPPTSC